MADRGIKIMAGVGSRYIFLPKSCALFTFTCQTCCSIVARKRDVSVRIMTGRRERYVYCPDIQ
jgi:hypothetical protein